ncbi:MAG: proline dehydrogenase family protein [Candidatus Dormibacteria bacterium]
MNAAARSAILAAASNRRTEKFMNRYGMRLGASRFVAGETLDQCVQVIRHLNQQGFKCNATELGEAVQSEADAGRAVQDYEVLLNRLAAEKLTANVAVKLTLMGLDVGEDLAESNLAHLLDAARGLGLTMRIDMEESSHVDATLRIYRRLRERGYDNVGAVLQSYLYRSSADLESLLPLAPNLRLVKGAYLESREVAFPNKRDVDRSYVRIMEAALRGGCYTAIATHDEQIIEHAVDFVASHGIGRERFEFQMLYGVRPQLQRSLLARGYTVLVATSYGTHWYPFFMRRLAERPANVLFLARNLARR